MQLWYYFFLILSDLVLLNEHLKVKLIRNRVKLAIIPLLFKREKYQQEENWGILQHRFLKCCKFPLWEIGIALSFWLLLRNDTSARQNACSIGRRPVHLLTALTYPAPVQPSFATRLLVSARTHSEMVIARKFQSALFLFNRNKCIVVWM